MTKKILTLVIFAAFAALMTACNPTAESILKKYEGYKTADLSENRLGFRFFHQPPAARSVFFANTSDYLNEPKENYNNVRQNMKDILPKRIVVLDANDPSKPVTFKVLAGYGVPEYTGAVDVRLMGLIMEETPRFILVGFQGVRESESAQWETPAMFLLFENAEGSLRPLTSEPLLAGGLFPSDFPEAQFVAPQPLIPVISSRYEERITLGGGKTLSVSFNLSDKGGQRTITECRISIETSGRNADGSNRITGNNHFGYDMAVAGDGSFSQTMSDYTVSGKVGNDRITGTIRSGGANYSYSARAAKPESGNTNVYKSIEFTTLR